MFRIVRGIKIWTNFSYYKRILGGFDDVVGLPPVMFVPDNSTTHSRQQII